MKKSGGMPPNYPPAGAAPMAPAGPMPAQAAPVQGAPRPGAQMAINMMRESALPAGGPGFSRAAPPGGPSGFAGPAPRPAKGAQYMPPQYGPMPGRNC